MHKAYLAAGARLLTTNTFCCDADSLSASGVDQAELAWAGARLARQAVEAISGSALVAGSLGPGWYFPSRGEVAPARLQQSYARWASGLLAGGVDLLWLETVQDPLQAEAAVAGCRQALAASGRKVPIALLLSLRTPTRLLREQPLERVLRRLAGLKADIWGFNCGFGPAGLAPALGQLRSIIPEGLIACFPNAGPDSAHYLSPPAFAAELLALAAAVPIDLIGGCCGTGPAHIAALASELAREKA